MQLAAIGNLGGLLLCLLPQRHAFEVIYVKLKCLALIYIVFMNSVYSLQWRVKVRGKHDPNNMDTVIEEELLFEKQLI